MKKFILPQHECYGKVFAIINTISGTYVCPGWHPVPAGTTREQIEFDMTSTPSVKKAATEEPKMANKEWQIESSKKNKFYTVSLRDATWDCTCPAKNFHRGDCKHIKAQKSLQEVF